MRCAGLLVSTLIIVFSSVLCVQAAIVLDESDLKGGVGYQYWEIREPGTYTVSINGQLLSTNNNYAIRIYSSNVYLNGNGLKITGPGIPPNPYGNSGYGVHIYNNSCMNVTLDNIIIEKKNTGIFFEGTKNARAEDIILSGNSFGIGTARTENIDIFRCQFIQNSAGQHSNSVNGDKIHGCTFTSNLNGFYALNGENIKIFENTFTNNQNNGIWLDRTIRTTIEKNYINNSGFAGLYVGPGCNDNIIFNNYCKNENNIDIDSSVITNRVSTGLTSGTNIIGGSKIGGNYWNDLVDRGFSEMALDQDGDGICDEAYVLSPGNIDYYPLRYPETITILNESNVKGSSGYQYWDILNPGTYLLGISGGSFYTNNNYAIKIASSHVILDGNGKTITGPSPPTTENVNDPSRYGIRVNAGLLSENVTIKNVNVEKKAFGVIFEFVNGGGVEYGHYTGNTRAIYAWKCNGLNILHNEASANGNGIVLDSADNSPCNYFLIDGNTLSSNNDFGVILWKSSNHNIISNNIVTNNRNMGIALSDGGINNTIDSNTISGSPNGIYLYRYHNNKIINNELDRNSNDGIWLDDSDNNQCRRNQIMNTGYTGIYLGQTSSGNVIIDNYLKNIGNAAADGTATNNQWSITPVSGPNIIDGPRIGGNFWSNPSGTGFSDIQNDGNGDGFCDNSYSAYRVTDYYPLHYSATVPSPGGYTLSRVAMDVKSATGEWFMVIRGTDNHLYFNRYTSSTNSWSGWTPLGGTTYEEPAVAYTGDNHFHVVIRGTDDVLYTRMLNLATNTWDSGWTSLGGHTASAPALLSLSSSQIPGDPADLPKLWLAIRGTDNHLYFKQYDPAGGWISEWQSWGGTTYDRPALALRFDQGTGNGSVTLGVRGTDNRVYTRNFAFNSGESGFLGPWTSPGGSTLSAPVIRYKENVLHIVVRGTDNRMYHKSGSSPYAYLGGTTKDMPAAFAWPGVPSFEVSVRGTDSKIYDKVLNLNTNQWTGWTDMLHTSVSAPTFSGSAETGGILALQGSENEVYIHVI